MPSIAWEDDARRHVSFHVGNQPLGPCCHGVEICFSVFPDHRCSHTPTYCWCAHVQVSYTRALLMLFLSVIDSRQCPTTQSSCGPSSSLRPANSVCSAVFSHRSLWFVFSSPLETWPARKGILSRLLFTCETVRDILATQSSLRVSSLLCSTCCESPRILTFPGHHSRIPPSKTKPSSSETTHRY